MTSKAGTSANGAAQPAKSDTSSLKELNTASVIAGGCWTVVVCNPIEDTYEYTWQGKQRTGAQFVITLVSPQNPEAYCLAQFRKTLSNTKQYNEAVKKVVDQTSFQMSKVAFVESAKTQYVNTPIKLVVNLALTKMETVLLGCPKASAVQPCPPHSVAMCSFLDNQQFFDVTALVQDTSDVRGVGNDRQCFSINIIDGTVDKSTNKIKVLPLSVYDDKGSKRFEDKKALADSSLLSKKAISFFCIKGAQDSQANFTFTTTKNTWFIEATGDKASKLNGEETLHKLQAEDTVAFKIRTSDARDWSQEMGTETRCALLASFANKPTGVQALDENETIWQLNWVRVADPATAQSIKTNDGTRIWFPLSMHDHTGPLLLYITERAALKLAKVTDATEFEKLHAEERLHFPIWASVKAMRKPKPNSVAQPASCRSITNEFVGHIVQAEEQSLQDAPTTQSTMLLPLLDKTLQTREAVLPALLDMIEPPGMYALSAKYKVQPLPAELQSFTTLLSASQHITKSCSQIIALIESSERSKLEPAGPQGHKLVTENVRDISCSNGESDRRYKLTTYCTLDTVTDLKLDPPRGAKTQAAMISISAILDSSAEQPTSLLVDTVQLLTAEDATTRLTPVMRKMICFTALSSQMADRKRAIEGWSEEESPGKAARCRTLGRSPTGQELPEYTL